MMHTSSFYWLFTTFSRESLFEIEPIKILPRHLFTKKEKKIEDDSFWFRLVCLIARNVSKLEWLLLTFKFDEKSSKNLIPLGSSSDLFWLAFFPAHPDRWWQICSDVVVQLKKLKGQNQTWYSKLTLRPRPATPPLWNLSEKSSRIQPVLVI